MEERLLTQKNEIVVYQPSETLRLEVRLQDESIWLPQQKIADLFGVKKAAISKHLKNIFATGELHEELVVSKMETTTRHGAIGGKVQHHLINFYNLDVIIAVGYRVNSLQATKFRIWATQVLKRYILNGVAVDDRRYLALSGEMDRRLASHDRRIVELEEKVDYFVQTTLPPKEKVLCDGQMLDAQFELTHIVKTARHRIVLIDNYIDERTLLLLGNRRVKVDCTVYRLSPTRRNLLRHSPITRNSIRPCRLRSRATRSRTIASSSLTTRCGTSVPRSRMRVPRSSR